MHRKRSQSGQTTFEYILLIAFILTFTLAILGVFQDFFRGSLGNIAHTLGGHLMVGVCPQDCYFSNYRNGYEAQ